MNASFAQQELAELQHNTSEALSCRKLLLLLLLLLFADSSFEGKGGAAAAAAAAVASVSHELPLIYARNNPRVWKIINCRRLAPRGMQINQAQVGQEGVFRKKFSKLAT